MKRSLNRLETDQEFRVPINQSGQELAVGARPASLREVQDVSLRGAMPPGDPDRQLGIASRRRVRITKRGCGRRKELSRIVGEELLAKLVRRELGRRRGGGTAGDADGEGAEGRQTPASDNNGASGAREQQPPRKSSGAEGGTAQAIELEALGSQGSQN